MESSEDVPARGVGGGNKSDTAAERGLLKAEPANVLPASAVSALSDGETGNRLLFPRSDPRWVFVEKEGGGRNGHFEGGPIPMPRMWYRHAAGARIRRQRFFGARNQDKG